MAALSGSVLVEHRANEQNHGESQQFCIFQHTHPSTHQHYKK